MFPRPRRRRSCSRLIVESLEGRSLLTGITTSLSVAVSNSSLFFSETETITATASVASGVPAPDGGTVTFYDNGNEIGTAVVSAGTASFTTSSLNLGSNALTASYGGFTGTGGLVYESSVATGTQSYLVASGLSVVSGVAADDTGDIFVADSVKNDVIEVAANGTQSTVATGLSQPSGLAEDSQGSLFIADTDNNRIVEVKPSGQSTTFASGLASASGGRCRQRGRRVHRQQRQERGARTDDHRQRTDSRNRGSDPESVAVDAAGDVFIADTGNKRVVEVPAGAPQTTIVTGISSPYGLAVDSAGSLFIAAGQQVVEVTPQKTQTTFDNNVGFASSVAVDGQGNVVIGDSGNDSVPIVAPGVLVTMSPVPTGTSVTASSVSTDFGQAETLTATISVPGGVAIPGTGSVTFYDGTTPLGQSTVSGGIATLTTSTLAVGSHTITAAYGGAQGYVASASGIEAGAARSRSCRPLGSRSPPAWQSTQWEKCSSVISKMTAWSRSRRRECKPRS